MRQLPVLLMMILGATIMAEDNPLTTTMGEFRAAQKTAFEKLGTLLKEAEKDRISNARLITNTLKAMGEIGDERAVPLLLDRLCQGPLSEGKPTLLSLSDRFPAADALAKFGAKEIDSAIQATVRVGNEDSAVCLAYYLTRVLPSGVPRLVLESRIASERDAARLKQLKEALSFIDKLPKDR